MAIIYRAVLSPGKLELLNSWLANVPWGGKNDTVFERVDGYRFDDPAGEVGIEVFLLQAGDGPLLHVPVTYRGAPLPDGEDALIGTMDHSVLGTRYVYDATADPVAVTAFIDAIMTGATNAEMIEVVGDAHTVMEQTARIVGSGVAERGIDAKTDRALAPVTDGGVTRVTLPAKIGGEARDVDLALRRTIEVAPGSTADEVPALNLTGTWTGANDPQLLAWIPETE